MKAEKPSKPMRKPVVIDPRMCTPLPVGPLPPACLSCAQPARWLAPPHREEVVRQVEAGQGNNLVPMCSICVIYKSILFAGQHARLEAFLKEVEIAGETLYRKEGGKLVDPTDANNVVANIWMTSYVFTRKDQLKGMLEARTLPDVGEDGNIHAQDPMLVPPPPLPEGPK